jgi:prepilin-type N-terminal cleavage/methylation domain-containing protein
MNDRGNGIPDLGMGLHRKYKGMPDQSSGDGWNFMKRECPTRGFSLIELLIAMALVAIVATISVPQFQRYSTNADLKTAAREVAADIFNTKQAAIGGNLNVYRLTFSVASNNYSLSRIDSGVTLWTKPLTSFGSGLLINNVTFGASVIAFDKRGTSSAGSVTLANKIGSTAQITVNFTGRTYVKLTLQ